MPTSQLPLSRLVDSQCLGEQSTPVVAQQEQLARMSVEASLLVEAGPGVPWHPQLLVPVPALEAQRELEVVIEWPHWHTLEAVVLVSSSEALPTASPSRPPTHPCPTASRASHLPVPQPEGLTKGLRTPEALDVPGRVREELV